MRYFVRKFENWENSYNLTWWVCLSRPEYRKHGHFGVAVNSSDSRLSSRFDYVYMRWVKSYCEDTQDLNATKWSF